MLRFRKNKIQGALARLILAGIFAAPDAAHQLEVGQRAPRCGEVPLQQGQVVGRQRARRSTLSCSAETEPVI